MAEFRREAGEGEVLLNNVAIPIEGPIGWDLLNSYGRKIQQGDPGPDDHQLDSTITQASWTGGIGTRKYRGDDSRGNSWFSTMWMQTVDALVLPPKTLEFSVAGQESELAFVHDKLGGLLYVTFGKHPRKWNETTDTFDTIAGLPVSTGTPSGPGVTWGNASVAKKIYIPMGASYETFDGSVFAAGAVGEGAIAFAIWEEKLFKLDASGVLKVTVDGATWTNKGRINSSEEPRNLFVFYNKSNNQIIHVVSSGRLYGLDYVNSTLVETDMWWPDHPYQGTGVTRWRGDAYVSAGTGVHRNNNGLIQAVGPDGRDGLPEEYEDGYFSSLTSGYNGLYGTFNSGDLSFTPAAETADALTAPPEAMYAQNPPVNSMLLEYTGLGWHPRWTGNDQLTNAFTVSTSGVYRVFWGSRGKIRTIVLSRAYFNPEYNQNKTELARQARHETPYFTWGFDDTSKIMKMFEIQTHGCSADNYLDVWYRIDDEVTWRPLATITTDGEHHFHIGFESIAGDSFHLGLPHEKIQFAFDVYGDPDDEFATPIIEWYQLVGRKWMRPILSFSFTVNATQPHDRLSPFGIWLHCLRAATRKGGSTLVVGNKTFVVDITSGTGNFTSGGGFASVFNIHAAMIGEMDDLADQLDEDA